MKQSRIQKTRRAQQNQRQDSGQDPDGPDVHGVAREARRRASVTSERAQRFLDRTA